MSTWRRKAIECVPELRDEFDRPDTTIYSVFRELLPALVDAHKENNTERLRLIYDFAAWCHGQKQEDLWNAAGVSFYEHLCDDDSTKFAMVHWVDKKIYEDVRDLLDHRMNDDDLKKLDAHYFGAPWKKKRN